MARPHLILTVALCFLSLSKAELVRKNVDSLTPEEILSLQRALREVTADTSEKGYAAIAAYHGYPPQCKLNGKNVACCVHGSEVFPWWHRLYTVQMEQALKEKGLTIGIPYWDLTQPLDDLPEVARSQLSLDQAGGSAKENNLFQGHVTVDGTVHNTGRAIDERLFQKVASGENTFLFEQVLNALEYHNYCQFEVQLEVACNTIHYLVGGRHMYSLSHLEYASYDPLFFLLHSNMDIIYDVYLTIQRLRGYTPGEGCTGKCESCAVDALKQHLEPFQRETNPFAITRSNARPVAGLDKSIFGYRYDNLTLNGYDVNGIEKLLKERTSHDRAFAAFQLFGIGTSADVRVKVCKPSSSGPATLIRSYCRYAGDFFILGGPLEMPWVFSRPFYFDITKTVLELGLQLTDNYFVEAELYSVNGTALPSDTLPAPSVHFRPAEGKTDPPLTQQELSHEHALQEKVSIRNNVEQLNSEEIYELREALEKFKVE